MSDEKNPIPEGFEWHEISPESEWFDQFHPRFFINTTKHPILIGFGHNIRTMEIIMIRDSEEKSKNSGALAALEGVVVKE